jgi:AraC family transcriptional regulator
MQHQPQIDTASHEAAPCWLRRTIEFIDTKLSQRITLYDIADHAGLSRMHFAAKFRRATGQSPHAFLTEKRVELAKTYLTEDIMPLSEIALAVGFNSQAHFTTVFHKSTGMTPGRWRKNTAACFSQAKACLLSIATNQSDGEDRTRD